MVGISIQGLFLALAASRVLGSAIPAVTSRILEEVQAPPRDWTFHSDALPHEPVRLHVSLKEQNLPEFEKLVLDISDPTHEKYGQHMKGHEVADMLRPAEHAISSVADWLQSHGVDVIRNTGEWMTFAANVSTIENMLSTRFGWYQHGPSGKKSLQTLAYSVPEHLHEHLNFLLPTIKFPAMHELRATHKPGNPEALKVYEKWAAEQTAQGLNPAEKLPSASVCGQSVTPQCLLNLYNVHYGAPANTTKTNKLSFASFLKQYARYDDLAQFESSVAPYAKGHNVTVIQFNNGGNDQNSAEDATEANLDAQYEAGVGFPTPLFEFSTGGNGPLIPDPGQAAGSNSNEPYTEFLTGVLAMKDGDIPQVISVSYGEDEQTWPQAQAQKICNMLAQLGSRGVTVLFAAGDNGPAGSGDYCENNDGSKQMYVPSFPAGCPFVTTVGGTTGVPEKAAGLGGGGFSNLWASPSYQTSAVQAFLAKQDSTHKKYYNASGRAYPDVAAQAENFIVTNGGSNEPVSGTSAATPTFAAIVGLLNAARIAAGKPTLGFLNPLIYQNAAAFNDITSGSSVGCSAGKPIAGAGFKAIAGWDAATGLGTANFGKLLEVVAPGTPNTGGVLGSSS